jgi:hypothetical protein
MFETTLIKINESHAIFFHELGKFRPGPVRGGIIFLRIPCRVFRGFHEKPNRGSLTIPCTLMPRPPIGHTTNPRLLCQLMQGQLLENQGLKSKRPYRWSTRPRRGGAGWMLLSLLIDLQGGPPTMAITRHVRTKWQTYDQTLQLLRSILGFSLGSKVTTSTPLGQPFRHSFPESLFPENK